MEEIVREATAGFPSPAESWRERPLNIQEFLVKNPDSTHYFRVKGYSMRDAGITEGDVLIVDRSLDAESGDIVVVALHGKHVVKRLEYVGEKLSQLLLCSAHPDYPPILVEPSMQASIWGVVVAVVRRMKRRTSKALLRDQHP